MTGLAICEVKASYSRRKPPLRDEQVRIFIHTGLSSILNGARTPVAAFFNLANTYGGRGELGLGSEDDSLVVGEKDAHVVVDLLTEAKILFKIQGLDEEWRNILTTEARETVIPRKTSSAV